MYIEPLPRDPRTWTRKPQMEDRIKAEKIAYKNERQGQILASHVLDLLDEGKMEGRAKVGQFPRRFPSNLDRQSVTAATNGALKERNADVRADVFNADDDTYGGVTNTVAVTHIDGEKIPTSKSYDRLKDTPFSPRNAIRTRQPKR